MKKIILIYSILLLIAGCTTEPDAEIQRINSKILINLKEDISEYGRKLLLNCETDSAYGCSNYGIAYQMQKNGNTIDLNFTNLIIPEQCLTSMGPAKTQVDLGALAAGTYHLRILINESVLQSTLSVYAESFNFSDSVGTWVKIVNPVLKRMPGNTIWGHVGFSSDSFVVAQVPLFFDTLKTLGAQEKVFLPGDYSYFTIDSTGNMTPPADPGTDNVIPFVYLYDNDILTLRSLIKYYGKNSPLSIALFTTKGDAFYTWQLGSEP